MKHTVEVMISEQEVAQRIRELGQRITEHYQGSSDLVLVGLLRGSFVFMADLARQIHLTHQVDFMTASSYGNSMQSSRDVRILKISMMTSKVKMYCWWKILSIQGIP